MARMKVAIYDTDKLYRERFADYLMNYKSQEIDLSVFTGISFLLDAITVDKYQLLVLGGGYEEVLPKLRNILIPVLVLTESTGVLVRESVGMEEKNCSFTSRYQSMDGIMRQMHLLAEVDEVVLGTKQGEVIGVYSPVHHEMQIAFSLLYAKNLAQKARVLYLNFIDFSGFTEIIGEKECDLSDLIMRQKNGEIKVEYARSCIYEQDGLSYICPPKNPEDLKLITGMALTEVISLAIEKLGYEVVVVDIGSITEDFSEVLKCCTKLYCINKSGSMYVSRQQSFFSYIDAVVGEEYRKRVKEVELPQIKNVTVFGKSLLEQLNWSEFGDYVRMQIGGSFFVDG